MVKRFTNDDERACSERTNQFLRRTLRLLARIVDIKLYKFDKGNGFAILEAEDYLWKLDKIIEDGSKFIDVKLQNDAIHPIIQKENSIPYYVKKHLKKIHGYAALIPSGSKPGKLYGLAKVHKNNTPLRALVSRRVARIWKRGGVYFETVRSVQTTLTPIFIDLESVSDGLSES